MAFVHSVLNSLCVFMTNVFVRFGVLKSNEDYVSVGKCAKQPVCIYD